MPMNRNKFKAADIAGQALKILSIAEQLKEAYKNDISMPPNKIEDVQGQFAPAHLFFSEKDLYYSDVPDYDAEYVIEFLDDDRRAPHRGFYKRTEVGRMYPEIVKDEDIPKPGDKLVTPRRQPVSIWQDESVPIPDLHFRNYVDFHRFDFAINFLNSEDYFKITNAIFDAIRQGNAMMERAIVDTFLASIIGLYVYPRGHELYPLFTDSDDYTPDDQYSKVSRGFLIKNGEIRKRLQELTKYVQKYYVARDSYLTNLNHHEVIGQQSDKTIPLWNKKLVDRGDATKTLKAVRDWFFTAGQDKKYKEVGYNLRRQSLTAFASSLFHMMDRMMTVDRRNWCGHKFGQENKDVEGYPLRCRPENMLVFMNKSELRDLMWLKGSDVQGPFTESMPIKEYFQTYLAKGVRFYGVDFMLPSMAIVLDKISFRLVEYYREVYNQFHAYDLVDSKIEHIYKKIVLYTKVACNTLELAAGQKYAAPIGWGSEILPMLTEAV